MKNGSGKNENDDNTEYKLYRKSKKKVQTTINESNDNDDALVYSQSSKVIRASANSRPQTPLK